MPAFPQTKLTCSSAGQCGHIKTCQYGLSAFQPWKTFGIMCSGVCCVSESFSLFTYRYNKRKIRDSNLRQSHLSTRRVILNGLVKTQQSKFLFAEGDFCLWNQHHHQTQAFEKAQFSWLAEQGMHLDQGNIITVTCETCTHTFSLTMQGAFIFDIHFKIKRKKRPLYVKLN